MRLFTALWPSAEVVSALRDAAPDLPASWRPEPPERWHVTLAFHGEDDLWLRRWMLDGLAGARAPRLRTSGTGTFPGVLWARVETASPSDMTALRALVDGAGGNPDGFVAHLTLARGSGRRRIHRPHLPPGPWWTPSEVALVASERDDDGLHYRTVHRVPLARLR